jgi:dihydroorotate dehydrogenase electron transfer subunit
VNARVADNLLFGEKLGLITLQAPKVADNCFAGQFIMLKTNLGYEPLLRRPFAPYSVQNGLVNILYAIVGRGTKFLSLLPKGTELSISYPKGTYFSVQKSCRAAFIAGGVGIAPIHFLLDKYGRDSNLKLYYGVNTKSDFFEPLLIESNSYKKVFVTVDGSFGEKGLITDIFEREISDFDRVYCCGPVNMTKRVLELCRGKVTVEYSLESVMACGIGVCGGCLLEANTLCCKDGPVFINPHQTSRIPISASL